MKVKRFLNNVLSGRAGADPQTAEKSIRRIFHMYMRS